MPDIGDALFVDPEPHEYRVMSQSTAVDIDASDSSSDLAQSDLHHLLRKYLRGGGAAESFGRA